MLQSCDRLPHCGSPPPPRSYWFLTDVYPTASGRVVIRTPRWLTRLCLQHGIGRVPVAVGLLPSGTVLGDFVGRCRMRHGPQWPMLARNWGQSVARKPPCFAAFWPIGPLPLPTLFPMAAFDQPHLYSTHAGRQPCQPKRRAVPGFPGPRPALGRLKQAAAAGSCDCPVPCLSTDVASTWSHG